MNKKGLFLLPFAFLIIFLLGMGVYPVHSSQNKKPVHKKGLSRKKGSAGMNGLTPFMKRLKEKEKARETQTKTEPKKVLLHAPLVDQMPELPRGCEVSSLAMLLQFAGVKVTKMELAEKIKKNPTPFRRINGQVHYGNPNEGFVGDLYSLKKPGYGVYHGPIAKLAKTYMGNRIVDLTGKPFRSVLDQLNAGYPVWVIDNSHFAPLPEQYWETWVTPEGKIKITYKEHSVLVTGFDRDHIYFNDPLAGEKNRKAGRKAFIQAWKQMGSQAISIRNGQNS